MENLESLINRLGASKALARAAVFNGVRKAGLLVERDAKLLCPVDTGNLRGSIHTDVENTAQGAEAIVYTNVDYAPYVEYGTGEKGDPSVSHRLGWKGSPPHPFMRPALAFNRDSGNIRRVVAAEVRKVLK